MNLILFDPGEISRPLPPADPRTRHISAVLKPKPGQSFDCGLIDGPRGKATVSAIDDNGVHLRFAWGEPPPALDPIALLVGLPRPQTVRKILGEVTAIGIARIFFFRAGKSEASYADSRLWTTGEVRRHLIAGAEQAFCTRLPEVALVNDLSDALRALATATTRIALDNYEAAAPLSRTETHGTPSVLAIGPERGWSSSERDGLRAAGFSLAHLGPRVLRTETACVAGLTLLRARLDLL